MEIDFEKMGGLVPAIIQDAKTKTVLMLGYMNKEAYEKTTKTGKVTFFSRSRQCLWTKGETSGNFLELVDIMVDCDNDTLLVKVNPTGPTCHKGTDTACAERMRVLLFVMSDFGRAKGSRGRFYKLVSLEGSISIWLGCLSASRTISFCFSFSHVARYAPSWKTKTYGTIGKNSSQANL